MRKSTKRGERRFRSYSKWMTRLKKDWNEHGWGTLPNGKPVCDCFILTHRQAWRFKDTPTLNVTKSLENSKPREMPSYAKDIRKLPVERERYGGVRKYKTRDVGLRRWKMQCLMCGFLIKRVVLKNDYRTFYDYRKKLAGGRFVLECDGCKKKRAT